MGTSHRQGCQERAGGAKSAKKKNNNNKTERPSTFSSQVYALVASVADGVKYVIWGRKLGRLKDKCLF